MIRQIDPVRRWKLSPTDLASLDKWGAYTDAKEAMFAYTDTEHAPWTVVKSNDKKRARVNALRHVLHTLDYTDKDTDPDRRHRPADRRARRRPSTRPAKTPTGPFPPSETRLPLSDAASSRAVPVADFHTGQFGNAARNVHHLSITNLLSKVQALPIRPRRSLDPTPNLVSRSAATREPL